MNELLYQSPLTVANGGWARPLSQLRTDASARNVSGRSPPGRSRGSIAARKRHVGQMATPSEAGATHYQKFAAPDCPIGSQSGAVKHHPDNRNTHSVFGHARGHVRVMVLYCYTARDVMRLRESFSKTSGGIVWMQVVRDHRWMYASHAQQVLHGITQGVAGEKTFKVANVRR